MKEIVHHLEHLLNIQILQKTMTKLKELNDNPGEYLFNCPGCNTCHHVILEKQPNRPLWKWNKSLDKPTISPSIRVKWTNSDVKDILCHSFIKDGEIQFLGDCTHHLKNQTIELPDW